MQQFLNHLTPLPFIWIKSWLHPLYWIGFFIPILHIFYTRRIEKKVFGYNLHSPLPLICKNSLLGIGFGVLLTLLLSIYSFSIQANELMWLWMITILFGSNGVRFFSFSYSAGFVAIVSLTLKVLGVDPTYENWGEFATFFLQFSTYDWLWMVGFLHLLGWLLIRIDGADGYMSVYTEHRSGFQLSKAWYIPMIIWTPTGWLPLPAIISFAALTLSKSIEQQKRKVSTLTLFYSVILCLAMIVSSIWSPFLWFAAIFSILGHEAIYQWVKWKEQREPPLYVSDERGLKVFAVLPNSPAEEMKIKVGDIIQRVNGVPVYTNEQLESIIKGATVCKCEVLDNQLNRHVIQKVIYEDDPKNLGIIGAIVQQKEMKNASLANNKPIHG